MNVIDYTSTHCGHTIGEIYSTKVEGVFNALCLYKDKINVGDKIVLNTKTGFKVKVDVTSVEWLENPPDGYDVEFKVSEDQNP